MDGYYYSAVLLERIADRLLVCFFAPSKRLPKTVLCLPVVSLRVRRTEQGVTVRRKNTDAF